MTKEEFAQQYAEEKAAEMAELLKAAYLKGYEQGELKVACSISIEGVEYYDLGLPSGTLWSEPLHYNSSKFDYRTFSHNDASRFDGLPTEAQWEELKEICRIHSYNIIGRSGERISIWSDKNHRGEFVPEGNIYSWLKSEMDEKGEAKAGRFNADGLSVVSHFAGYRLPVMLTKKREEI